MSVFAKANAGSRSRRALYAGVAGLGAVALVLSGCAADNGGNEGNGNNSGEDLTMNLGTMLPLTGSLAFLGPPEFAGVDYAVSQINEADAGITIEVSPYPIETYWEEVWLNGPFYVSEWFRRYPVEALSVMCGGDAPWNESNYRDAELDSLIEEALRVSGDEQAEIIGRALTKVADESGLGIPGFRRRLFAAKPGLTGLRHTTFTVISFEDVRLG